MANVQPGARPVPPSPELVEHAARMLRDREQHLAALIGEAEQLVSGLRAAWDRALLAAFEAGIEHARRTPGAGR
jgi:uncharacterized protein YukE